MYIANNIIKNALKNVYDNTSIEQTDPDVERYFGFDISGKAGMV